MLVETWKSTQLLREVLRRTSREELPRAMGISVAALARRAQDYDDAKARHPSGRGPYTGPWDDPGCA